MHPRLDASEFSCEVRFMAHTYICCKACGAVQRTKQDMEGWKLAQAGQPDEACANSLCKGGGFNHTQGKRDVARLIVKETAVKILKTHRYIVKGPVKYSIKLGPGQFDDRTFQTRDLQAALQRLVSGEALPIDVNQRQHFHDGGKYKGQWLPIRDVKDGTTYYTEWGVLSSSRGWEVNLGSERLITGASGEIYYSSFHYNKDWWWVFNAANGDWYKFVCRW
jgi:hypothetical protein